MTLLQLKVEVPDQLAREAQAAGLLTARSISKLLRNAMRRQAGERLLAGAARAGSRPLSMRAIQKEVAAVRAARKARAAAAHAGKNGG